MRPNASTGTAPPPNLRQTRAPLRQPRQKQTHKREARASIPSTLPEGSSLWESDSLPRLLYHLHFFSPSLDIEANAATQPNPTKRIHRCHLSLSLSHPSTARRENAASCGVASIECYKVKIRKKEGKKERKKERKREIKRGTASALVLLLFALTAHASRAWRISKVASHCLVME